MAPASDDITGPDVAEPGFGSQHLKAPADRSLAFDAWLVAAWSTCDWWLPGRHVTADPRVLPAVSCVLVLPCLRYGTQLSIDSAILRPLGPFGKGALLTGGLDDGRRLAPWLLRRPACRSGLCAISTRKRAGKGGPEAAQASWEREGSLSRLA
jgi:hypothetical protein